VTLIEDLHLALAAGLAGARLGLGFYRRVATLSRQEKADGSVVTQADLAVEEEVKRVLTTGRPDDAFLGEETGSSGSASRRWVLDGIDGTLVFVRGEDRWQTLLALELDGQVVVAVAVVPAQGRLWWAARGLGAWLQEFDGDSLGPRRRLRAAASARSVGILPPLDLLAEHQRGPLLRLAELGPLRHWPVHAALLVASGEFGLAVQVGGKLWDYAALSLIVQEAGGQATGHDGSPYPFDGTAVFSSDTELHQHALRHLTRR